MCLQARINGSYAYLFEDSEFGVDKSDPNFDFVPGDSGTVFLANIWLEEVGSPFLLSLKEPLRICCYLVKFFETKKNGLLIACTVPSSMLPFRTEIRSMNKSYA